MEYINSKCLESLLIAEEGFFDKMDDDAKSAFLSLLVTTGIIGIFGGYSAYKQYKAEKAGKSSLHRSQNNKQSEFAKFNSQYHFENMSKPEYDKYIDNTIKSADKDVKTIVSTANKNKEYINKIKEKYIRTNEDNIDNDVLVSFKPGMFGSTFEEGYYWVIIDDQDVAGVCDFHYEVADALKMKYSNPIISFDNGDGDEGCVYIQYPSYDGLQRILKKNNIIH